MRTRATATLLVLVSLVAGTAWGDDDNFPFGPFRMFSKRNRLDGEVHAVEVRAVTASGRVVVLEYEHMGLRRAEVEGQVPRIVRDPEVLRYVVESYRTFVPDAPSFVEVRLVNRIRDLRHGIAVGAREEILAVWRPG